MLSACCMPDTVLEDTAVPEVNTVPAVSWGSGLAGSDPGVGGSEQGVNEQLWTQRREA